MSATTTSRLFRQRLAHFTYNVLMRLRFFPFTLLYVLFTAMHHAIQLRRGRVYARIGEIAAEAAFLPRNMIFWLESVSTRPPNHLLHLCLRLPQEAPDANLQDVLSVLLTIPRVRSIGLYWDSSSLIDDLPLLQAKPDQSNPAASPALYEGPSSPSTSRYEEFLRASHAQIALPVAARREAQTMLKRQAGGAYAVCLNLPVGLDPLVDGLAKARPDVRFFDLSSAPPRTARAVNIQSLFGHGLTLHERMALVQAADAYVGSFDELGCAAVMSARPAVLLGGGAGAPPAHVVLDGTIAWFPCASEPVVSATAVHEFLSRHFVPGEK
jgi:hypothetical protein